jgi:thiamine pyrophosphate-dependent acetolactate synthase large subunit-like protein
MSLSILAVDGRSPEIALSTALPDEGHVSAAVADVLATRAGHLFGLMGNGNAHLISRLTRRGFPFMSARHEAATVAMADAYHRATGGVAAATTIYGAGFTNAYTTLAEARIARIPLVFVVGDAPAGGCRRRPLGATPSRRLPERTSVRPAR